MKFPDKEIKSVADLLQALKDNKNKKSPIWFRGQSDKSWTLVPSITREKNYIDAELTLIKRFKQNAMPFLSNHPETIWDWLFLMQHYGVPTRLLDWTESPLIALYFAVSEAKYSRRDGIVWCLLPKLLNINAGITSKHSQELPFFGAEKVVENYAPENVAQERTSTLKPIAVISARESRRLYAQLGVFTIIHRDVLPIEKIGDQNHIWKLIVPHKAKKNIAEELSFLSINRLALFPELPSVADVAKEILK
jgi:hypothetical protein